MENLKLSGVYPHSFNNAELASNRLMEDLSIKTTDGQFIRIAPNVFLYVSGQDGKCNLIAATPLHYFYSNLDTEPSDDNVVENNDENSENEDGENEVEDNDSSSNMCDSINASNTTCSDSDDLNNNVLIDNNIENSTDSQNIDLAHNAINDIDSYQETPINSVSVILPLLGNDSLANQSKDIEGKIKDKYNGQIFRHNDVMFTHIRPDGVIDRITTDESGHNCTSYK